MKKQTKEHFEVILALNKIKPNHIQYLSDETLHHLQIFLHNIIYNTLNLSRGKVNKVLKILSPHNKNLNSKNFKIKKLIKSSPQFGGALASLIGFLVPIISTLIGQLA